ncbi:ABC transporter permease [Sinirhodobacter populi]|uniref:ABC transporter permease n=1 Tax=Paenirhodobacter populi TaxID=2306993 RepID=A0A443K4H7_9RHOB|nr:ABC transporter permease [Sinirhodobacter populi]RWR27687.1 ABC transporter permease [Sinirhodobacter populi]
MSTTAESPDLVRPAAAGDRWRLLRSFDWRLNGLRLLVLVGFLGLWEVLARTLVDPLWISQPSAIAIRLWDLALNGLLWRHLSVTLIEAGLGLALAFAVGVPIGILLARFRYAGRVAEPFVMALYSMPRVVLAPLLILWFGIDLTSKVMMAFFFVVFIFILNIQEGLKTIDKDLLELMRTMRAPEHYVVRKVLIPWIIPWVIASMRLAIGSALIGALVAELVGSSRGLGWYAEHSAGRLDTTGVFAAVTVAILVAVTANGLVTLIERRFLSWRPAI